MAGIFAAVPYCIDLIGGPYLETREEVVKAFRPKSAIRPPRSLTLDTARTTSSSPPAPTPRGTVIWMHGLGADGWDFVPIVRELPLPEDLALRFIFPHAPMRPVTINNGMRDARLVRHRDERHRAPARRGRHPRIAGGDRAADRARDASAAWPPTRIVLAGFSQGGAIALQAGLRHREPLGGIVALSTYLPLEDSLDRRGLGRQQGARRSSWRTAPRTRSSRCSLAEASRSALEARGYDVEWHT